MEISHFESKPIVRSVITFTELEVKQALRKFAEKKGFMFNIDKNEMFVRYPPRDCFDRCSTVTLGVDVKGDKAGIRKSDKV